MADGIGRPPKGEVASQSAATTMGAVLASNRDTRLGVYNPSNIPTATIEKVERHPIVYMCQRMVAAPISTATLTVEGPEPLVAEVVRATLEPFWARLLDVCAEVGSGRGCAPWEIVWTSKDGDFTYMEDGVETTVTRSAWVIDKMKDLNPHDDISAIAVDNVGNFAGLNLAYTTNLAQPFLPSEKAFLYTHQKRFGNFWGRSRLAHSVYDSWYRQMLISDFYLQYLERRGTPPPFITHPAGQDDTGTDYQVTAANIGDALMSGDAYVTAPQEKNSNGEWTSAWDIKFLDDNQRGDMFKAAIETYNRFIARGYLIPDKLMTQEGSAGSFALSHTHADAFLQNEDSLLREIVSAVNAQIVPLIVRYNFPKGTPTPLVTTSGLRDDVREATFEIVKELIKVNPNIIDVDKAIKAAGFSTGKDDSGVERTTDSDKANAEMAYQFSERTETVLGAVQRELARRDADV